MVFYGFVHAAFIYWASAHKKSRPAGGRLSYLEFYMKKPEEILQKILCIALWSYRHHLPLGQLAGLIGGGTPGFGGFAGDCLVVFFVIGLSAPPFFEVITSYQRKTAQVWPKLITLGRLY